MGRGTYSSQNGDIYDCNWEDDKRNGLGFILYSNGDSFKGEFRDNKLDGFGTLYIAENK